MMRRGLWLTAGAVAGASATVWSRRRLVAIQQRAQTGEIGGDVVRIVQGGSRRIGRRVARAVEAGRLEARRREGELRRALTVRRAPH
ncbi:MAG: hypothetical protein ACYDD4_13285 [Acidimicrobiales bacterium]